VQRVCRFDELQDGKTFPATVDNLDIVLIREGDTVYALEDNCSHQDFPLALGEVKGGTVTCKAHGSRFDLATGKALNPPAFAPVAVYPIKVENGEVYVDVDA
jgi:3-phenylpropionate/trans-cinnamate dioxygenase ferredoxin subunit